MNQRLVLMSVFLCAAIVGSGGTAAAENFKNSKECVPGRRVINNGGEKGKILRYGSDQTLCVVLLDATGKEKTSIFWMLRAEGASSETDDKLVPGTYECFAGLPNQYTFVDLRIVSANTYVWAETRGKFHVEPSRKIVFEDGPLEKYTSKLLAGPSIGLNTNGGTFFGTHCDLKK